MMTKIDRRYLQFSLHTEDLDWTKEDRTGDTARAATFEIKRKRFDTLADMGNKLIEGFQKKHDLADFDTAAAASLRGLRKLLLQFREKVVGESREGSASMGTAVAISAMWYVKFRHETGFLKRFHPKRTEHVHMFFLDGNNDTDPRWPLIRIATGPYHIRDWKNRPPSEIVLPDLPRLDLWSRT